MKQLLFSANDYLLISILKWYMLAMFGGHPFNGHNLLLIQRF